MMVLDTFCSASLGRDCDSAVEPVLVEDVAVLGLTPVGSELGPRTAPRRQPRFRITTPTPFAEPRDLAPRIRWSYPLQPFVIPFCGKNEEDRSSAASCEGWLDQADIVLTTCPAVTSTLLHGLTM